MINGSLKRKQINDWYSKIEENIEKTIEKIPEMSDDELMEFVRLHYERLSLVSEVVDGKVDFLGTYHKSITK